VKKNTRTALIIEDDLNNRKLEKDLLQDAGYTVYEAKDAEKGLKVARKESPDVIILDYQLPGMNGLQALEKIIADPMIHNIPCVVVTASATERDIEVLKASDACGYILKPINTRTFVGQIEEMAAFRR